YQVQNVFRADKPQKGRYREFTQCDADIFGTTSPLADGEILTLIYYIFKNVGYPKISIKVNDRQTLFNTFKPFATEKVTVFSIIQSIDKLDKLSPADVKKELMEKGLIAEISEKILKSVENATMSKNLTEINDAAIKLGVPKDNLEFSPALARGLDYYTGMIFEVLVEGYGVGSCAGGGRFDNLIGDLGGKDVPAVGFALGFDRMVEAAEELKLFPDSIYEAAKVFVTVFSKDLEEKSLNAVSFLRSKNIATEFFVGEVKEKNSLEPQLKYAIQKGIPYVLILGPEEAEKNVVTLKNLQTREQTQLPLEEVSQKLLQ
ncbi:MAG: histidine--tRNA ligase, partial [Candidatus Levyibacteriota bacterium]